MGKISSGFAQNLVIAALVAVVGGIVATYANLPRDVAVLKTQMSDTRADQDDIKQTVHQILDRMAQ